SNTSNSNNTNSNNTNSNNTSEPNTSNSNNTNSNNNSSNNTASNSRNSSLTIPAVITSTVYGSIDNNSLQPHNDSNPIPILTSIPEGSFYTIQVGAFRRPVSNNTFTQFSPVFAEQQANGFIRYSSGFFVAYGEAKNARDAIRAMGYKDAFIVAYKNGKRVGYTAIMTTEELVSYNAGQNSSNNLNSNNNINSLTNTVSSKGSINTTYYNQEEGVSAKLIETSEGIFFTVQVGVYTKPTKNNALESLPALHVELMKNGNIRYMAGNFKTLQEASALKNELRNGSIPDAFITAYENGNRITISEAKQKLGIATE
ncbi:MAG: SPOR domain-containing protein, partial [Bacteroidota bacterium]